MVTANIDECSVDDNCNDNGNGSTECPPRTIVVGKHLCGRASNLAFKCVNDFIYRPDIDMSRGWLHRAIVHCLSTTNLVVIFQTVCISGELLAV